MIAAGRLSHRVRFERRDETGNDGFGNVLKEWTTLCLRWAAYRPEFGREAIAADRQNSTRAGTVTVRRDTLTATITAADRLVFVSGPNRDAVAQIRSIIPLNDIIEMTIEIGAAT